MDFAAKTEQLHTEAPQKLLELTGIVKRFYVGKPNELEILHGIDLDVYAGQFVSIVGASGSGKTTLMNLIGLLDRPTAGKYIINGIDIDDADDNDLSYIRNKEIGFVFQTYNLVPKTNALKNVELPLLYAHVPAKQRKERAESLLELVGMADRMKHMPEELSGGQKQRVAIARALANEPSILLADEPTGALDSVTGRAVMDLFHELHDRGTTILLITHSTELSDETERIISIKDGRITGEHQGKERHHADR